MTAERDERLARDIAESIGLTPGDAVPVVGQGSVNHVYVVTSGAERYVVRFAIDVLRSDDFEVETWCLGQARRAGIPSPVAVAVGVLHEVPYLVQTFVPGVPAVATDIDSWRTLGAYARVVHTIPLTAEAPDGLFSRFGRDVPAAWSAHLAYGLGELKPYDPLLDLAVYAVAQQNRLRSAVARLGGREFTFGLTHGDLSVRNLLLPPDAPPVLIDWGGAAAGPIPYGDLISLMKMQLADGNPSPTELAAFADGAGLDLEAEAEVLDDLLVLGYLDLVRWAMDNRPDRLPEIVVSSRRGISDVLSRSE